MGKAPKCELKRKSLMAYFLRESTTAKLSSLTAKEKSRGGVHKKAEKQGCCHDSYNE